MVSEIKIQDLNTVRFIDEKVKEIVTRLFLLVGSQFPGL
jgi:hypothetical protein